MRLLAREALKLAKDRAPAIVDERILPPMLDEIADYVGELMGKLTNLDAENETAVAMAHGIIRDRLVKEVIEQLQKDSSDGFEARLKKFSTLAAKKK